MNEKNLEVATKAFFEIRSRFPSLRIEEDESFQDVQLSWTIPIQNGLKYSVWLGFQNVDELNFVVQGNFSTDRFPITDPSVVEQFVNEVCGFLSGKYRVVEFYRGEKCVSGRLEAPSEGGWKPVSSWARLHFPVPWKKTTKVLQNA
jgi:hypothetical protein